MLNFKPYVSGSFRETNTSFDVIEKFTGQAFANIGQSDSDMLEKAIANSKAVESEMANLSGFEKYEILKYISDCLYEERGHFAEIIAKEAGKPIKLAMIEAVRASQTFMIAAEEAKRIDTELLHLDWNSNIKKEAVVKFFPIGTIAGITPFNFPLNLVAHKVAPAIAAGCPMILKPALNTPISSLELARIIQKSKLPKNAFSVLTMDHETSKPLIEDDRIKKISFTGSQEVGWQLKNKCGKKSITLELGGNAGVIVTPSANMEEAVPKCVTGAFAYAGQVCIHTQRIFVHNSIIEDFTRKFVSNSGKLKYGNPIDKATDISVLIDEPNAVRVEEWINEAVGQGAKILLGGARKGSFIEPCVMTNVTPEMKIWKDEVFGPVTAIIPYDNFEDAVEMVNNSVYGLQAGVFTNQIDEMNYAFNNIKAGGIMINESSVFRIDHMPYGGVKESGFGREGVKYAIKEMSEMKVMVKPC